jgi:hypothetical protein
MMKVDIARRNFILKVVASALALVSGAAQTATNKKSVTPPKVVTKSKLVTKPVSNTKLKKTLIADVSNSAPPSGNSSGARLGINLAGIADWNSELPIVDVFKMSREWLSQIDGGGWGAGPALSLDEHGYVKKLNDNCYATTFVCSDEGGHYYSGDYVILYDGEGEINIPFHTIKSNAKGRMVVKVDAKKGTLRLDLMKTNPQNYIKNIRLIMPGFEKTYQDNPWHPDFLSRWSGAYCIRFMDFMATNNSAQIRWENRPTPLDMSYATKGASIELMVDLANRLNTDPWFCMPHQADDDYIKQFANYVKTNLNPNLRAWVEYSNEVWNGGFEQNGYAGKQGQRLKFALQPWDAAWKYTAYRSVQIFKIWTDVFGGTERFIRVLPSQAGNSGVAEQVLSFQNAAKNADVLAIAPYFNFSVPPTEEDGISDKLVASWSVDKLFEHLNKKSIPESTQWIIDNKKIADKYKLKLVAYEDGQHLVGVAGAENNEQMEKLFLKANADARMGELYTKHLKAWTDNGGDLVCSFNGVSTWSKWGSWGLIQYYNDKPTAKFKAVMDWAKSRGQKVDY